MKDYTDNILETIVDVRRLNPQDGYHYFFGYYDINAFNEKNTLHLCHRTKFWERLPTSDDMCELGLIDVATGAWRTLAETCAFNFQQGAMLQWNPMNPMEEIIYNTFLDGCFQTAIHNINTSKVRHLPQAITNVSADGKWGIIINMSRVFDFRPGYGYSGTADAGYDVPQPKNDGIWIIDMETGDAKFIISFHDMGKLFSYDSADKLVINPATFSVNNQRLLFFVRPFPREGEARPWWEATGIGVINRDGTGFHMLKSLGFASHYNWRDDNHVLVYTQVNGVAGMYLFTDQSNEINRIGPDFFDRDIHCIYSPDKKYIAGDGYPDSNGYRSLYLYNTYTNKGTILLRVKSNSIADGDTGDSDIRCDLHNRWSRDGKFISFDSTHEGVRGLYMIDVSQVF